MLKFICDRCKQEFEPKQYFLEARIVENKPLMLNSKDGKPMLAEQQSKKLIHLCPGCSTNFENDFLKPQK